MGQINMGRVVLAGLLAGLIINVGEGVLNMAVLAGQFETMTTDFGIEPVGGGGIAAYMVFGFLLGIALVWVYAAIRPRFGPGPKTAVVAGGVVWFLARFWPTMDLWIFTGRLSLGTILIIVVWTLVEVVLAALAGGKVYAEGGAAPAATL